MAHDSRSSSDLELDLEEELSLRGLDTGGDAVTTRSFWPMRDSARW